MYVYVYIFVWAILFYGGGFMPVSCLFRHQVSCRFHGAGNHTGSMGMKPHWFSWGMKPHQFHAGSTQVR